MPLGSKEPPRPSIIYLSPRAMDKEKKVYPHFSVSKREGGQTVPQPDEFSVSGHLVEIGHGKYEYPKNSGAWVETIFLLLVDGAEMYKIEGSADTSLMRNLMNTVIGTKDWDFMRIRLYAKKDQQGNDNANIYITNNDQKTVWAFDYEKDIKPLVKQYPDPKVRGKMLKSYLDVNDLLMKHWTELEPYVKERARKMGYGVAPAAQSQQHMDQSSRDAVENLKEDDLVQFDANGNSLSSNEDLPF
ncbi:MAG: hypothetical protein QM762_12825 [Chryseolinea sp.]